MASDPITPTDRRTTRRAFLRLVGASAMVMTDASAVGGRSPAPRSDGAGPVSSEREITLFLGGDVMTGRGIDQILPRSVNPRIHEPWVKSATTYVSIAEAANGPIPRAVEPAYIWGDALDILDHSRPSARIVNLETSITDRGEPWPRKGIHYRMHPANVDVLTAADVDCCTLANNHVLDWGREGLDDTLQALDGAGIGRPGAGVDLDDASRPSLVPLAGGGRVLAFALGHPSSGIPKAWAARADRSGVWLADDLSDRAVDRLSAAVAAARRPGDLVVVSVHWGGNWGYEVPRPHRSFAHRILDEAGVDVVHGHSSHHPMGIEVHRGRPILYGCGDLINDYEGISGHETYRSELHLLYFPRFSRGDMTLSGLEMVPVESHRFRLRRASDEQTEWLTTCMGRICRPLGSSVSITAGGVLRLSW
jgi:poly-gamma-glutamate synthesis protein (capsule biosynthesis protein)